MIVLCFRLTLSFECILYSVEPETLAHIQGSDVGIGYMHVATLTGDTSKFIASVSSILEHSIGLRNKVHIVLVVHGDFAREKILTSGHPLSIESLKRKVSVAYTILECQK